METRISAGLSVSEGRRFGFTLGAAFIALGVVAWWRGHPVVAASLGALGGLLLAAGLLLPMRLGPVRQGWMGLAAVLSKVTTPLFMGIVYFVVITPIGLLRRAVGRNALAERRASSSCWIERPVEARNRRDMERQF